jgi:hypothetical protein
VIGLPLHESHALVREHRLHHRDDRGARREGRRE